MVTLCADFYHSEILRSVHRVHLCVCKDSKTNSDCVPIQHWLIFIAEMKCFYCAVLIEDLNIINPLNPELNPICHLLALLGIHHFLHVSRIRVNSHSRWQLSRYSDPLLAGWSRNRIPVDARFSAPVQNGPGDHPTSYTMNVVSPSWGQGGRGVVLTTLPSHLVPKI